MDQGAVFSTHPSYALKHSRFGIASFIIALLLGAAHFLNVVIAGILATTTPGGMNSRSPVALIIGTAMCAFLLVNLIGMGLGIAGMFERDRKKVFPILGALMNLGVMVGIVALVVLGLMIGE